MPVGLLNGIMVMNRGSNERFWIQVPPGSAVQWLQTCILIVRRPGSCTATPQPWVERAPTLSMSILSAVPPLSCGGTYLGVPRSSQDMSRPQATCPTSVFYALMPITQNQIYKMFPAFCHCSRHGFFLEHPSHTSPGSHLPKTRLDPIPA